MVGGEIDGGEDMFVMHRLVLLGYYYILFIDLEVRRYYVQCFVIIYADPELDPLLIFLLLLHKDIFYYYSNYYFMS